MVEKSVTLNSIILLVLIYFPDRLVGITASISTDISDFLGPSNVSMACDYSKENVESIISVQFEVFSNSSYGTFKGVIRYIPDAATTLTPVGEYLKGRVSYNNITQADTTVVLTFDNLHCFDQSKYRCSILFYDLNSIPMTEVSPETHVEVKVLPSIPDNITYSKFPQSDEDIFFSNILQEGDNVSILCSGNVGNPPGQLNVELTRKDGSVWRLEVITKSTDDFSENCLVIENRSYLIQLTSADNMAVFSCFVTSQLSDAEMYIETDPIDVKYAVQDPSILPDKLAENSYALVCLSDGNPEPYYNWYILQSNNKSDIELFVSEQNITLWNITQSGVFFCRVNNTINGKTHTKEVNITITYEGPSFKRTSDGDSKSVIIISTVVPIVVVLIGITMIAILKKRKEKKRKRKPKVFIDFI